MTQSGQGNERQNPAARPAHEGVVLPGDGSEPWIPGSAPQPAPPAGGRSWGGPWDAQDPQVPRQGAPYGGELPQEFGRSAQPDPHQPLPLPAETPLPGAFGSFGHADATQYLPPVPMAEQSGNAEATQFIPPVPHPSAGGQLPPEQSAEATQFLPPAPASGFDRTQYIAPFPAQNQGGTPAAYGPVPAEPGERQPPAEFDNLFRSDGAGGGGADSTRQLAAFDASLPPQPYGQRQAPAPYGQQPQAPYGQQQVPAPHGQQPAVSYGQQQPGFEPQEPPGGSGRRRPLAIIGAVVVGCAVIGLGAGALLSGGGDKKDNSTVPVAASAAPTAASGGGSGGGSAADPAKAQAQELDQLLADSNNSRESVIRAVANIQGCDNLDQAAGDLHAAAQQRRGLEDRLKTVKIDQLPDHEALASSLTKAWRASADADDFYAQWANQAKSKKVCKQGHAKRTSAAAQGDRASGEATAAKQQASRLWNGIAATYGLTERGSSQL